MSIDKLVELRIVQIDILVCWIIYICRAMILPFLIALMFAIEHKMSRAIRKNDAKLQLHRTRKPNMRKE